jgi:hypothetical protein
VATERQLLIDALMTVRGFIVANRLKRAIATIDEAVVEDVGDAAEHCTACGGTGKRPLPAFWPLNGGEPDPDDAAIAYACLIHRVGGAPQILFERDGMNNVTGIVVRDVTTRRNPEAQRTFACQPMRWTQTFEDVYLAAMKHEVDRVIKQSREPRGEGEGR